jgi:uncharacterized protein YeaO (DUF488 family)
MLKVKRVYAPREASDGYRVLIDRLWPRGLKREDAVIDLWLKELAPSAELRRWFDHEPSRWLEFQNRYRTELAAPEAQPHLKMLRERAAKGTVTLVFGARNETENNACALRNLLRGSAI